MWPPEKLKVPPPPGMVSCVRDAPPWPNVFAVSVLPAALTMSVNRATCWQASSGAVHVTGVDAVAVTGSLMTALGSAAWMVAMQRFIAGSFQTTGKGG